MTSLRRRLLAILLGSFAAAWLLLAVMSYWSARHEAEELFDAQLAQSARVLLALTVHELTEEEEGEEHNPAKLLGAAHPYEEKLAFQVWKGTALLMRSPNAPAIPMAMDTGYSDQVIDADAWRVFGLPSAQLDVRIFVGESYAVRNELIYDTLRNVLLPVLFALPLLAILTWGGVRRGLRPMDRVARDIAQRSPTQLQPIGLNDVPEEIRPLADSLNRLLERLEDALESERRFTANAAHELRTPLAGLRAQAQVALRAEAGTDRTAALHQIIRGVDRATRLVEQLLTLARLDPEIATRGYVPVDMLRLVTGVLAELADAAHAKRIDIGLVETSRGTILGDAGALAILVRNLIDNAIRYTPPGGRIEVAVTERAREVLLTVSDTGPGIPAAERERVFERFHRLADSDGSGSGLGLAIVRRIADLHRATVGLASASSAGGLFVSVVFPCTDLVVKDGNSSVDKAGSSPR